MTVITILFRPLSRLSKIRVLNLNTSKKLISLTLLFYMFLFFGLLKVLFKNTFQKRTKII